MTHELDGLMIAQHQMEAPARRMIELRVSYDFSAWPEMDDAARNAAGRGTDFSGMGMGQRDLGWVCESEIEAARIERGLKRIGLYPVRVTK